MRIICKVLNRDGRTMGSESKEFTISIPPGCQSGTTFTFPKQGHQAPNTVPADVVFVVKEHPHHRFKREGADIRYVEKLPLRTAFIGGTIHMVTLGRTTIPLHVKWEDIIYPKTSCRRIQGLGLPYHNQPNRRGDLIVEFEINLSEWQRYQANLSDYNSYIAELESLSFESKRRLKEAEKSLQDPSTTVNQLDVQFSILSSDNHQLGCSEMKNLLSKAKELCSSLPAYHSDTVTSRKIDMNTLINNSGCCRNKLEKILKLWKAFELEKEKFDLHLDQFVEKMSSFESRKQAGIFAEIKSVFEDLLSEKDYGNAILDQLSSISNGLKPFLLPEEATGDSTERYRNLLEQYKVKLFEWEMYVTKMSDFDNYLAEFNSLYLQSQRHLENAEQSLQDPSTTANLLDVHCAILSSDNHQFAC